MFNSPFDFLPLVIAIAAFIFARKAFNQAAVLRARLDAIEAVGLQARPSGPPPLTPLQELEQTLAASPPAAGPEQPATTDEPAGFQDEAAATNQLYRDGPST